MSSHTHDHALSEVIGFILILGLLTVIMGLYVTYIVPSEGRDAEIAHLDYIKQQFLNYKLSTDALWVNSAEGASLTQSIELGAKGATTEGMFANFALLQPIGSGGTLSVNSPDRRERLVVEASGLVEDNSIQFGVNKKPIPEISNISPASIEEGSGDTTISVVGNGFITGSDDIKTQVFWNGEQISADDVIVSNARKLTFTLTADELEEKGFGNIRVFNIPEGGGESNSDFFTITNKSDNQVPVIISITTYPSPPVKDQPFDITINCDNPAPNAKINWNGTPLSTPGLTKNIPVELNRQSGPIVVSVTNPIPGGGTSKGMSVYVSDGETPPPEIEYINPASISPSTPITIYGSGFDSSCVLLINGAEMTPSSFSPTALGLDTTNIENGLWNVAVLRTSDNKQSNKIVYSSGRLSMDLSSSGSNLETANKKPSNYYVYFKTNEITYAIQPRNSNSLTPPPYGINLTDSINNLSIIINATPRVLTATYRIETGDIIDLEDIPDVYDMELDDDPVRKYNVRYTTDLVLSIRKENVKILDNLTIQSNIIQGKEYQIDILDPAYGTDLGLIYPSYFHVDPNFPDDPDPDYSHNYHDFSASYEFNYDEESGSVAYSSVRPTGSLEYQSYNYYYPIQQLFNYQTSMIYVNQSAGQSPVVLPPISIERVDNFVRVKIVDISIQGDDRIGGSSPVQITTTLNSVKQVNAAGNIPNAKTVTIGFDPIYPWNRDLWINILKAIENNAVLNGVPNSSTNQWMYFFENPPRLIINGSPDTDQPDIIFEHIIVDNSVELQAVGKTVTAT